ncbi:hypothetical protein [Salinibacterium sp. ZJ454]|uniref:hypothetical protein n=1 Tax=Salinibacterium sp. ZJ454 TaxID=2708339 RepID=UPI00141EEA81|nr:hypothetical protein [Salinibacterium sp. ZJ454]
MVAQFLRLKLRLLANTLKRSPWQVVGTLVGLLYGLGFAVFGFLALVGLRLVEIDTARAIVVTAGTLIVAGTFIVPLFFGIDDPLDPRKFSLFGIDTTTLATALAVSTLLGVPALAATVVGVGQVVTFSRGVLATLLSILAIPIIVATCLLAARVSTSIGAFALASRRARDATALVAVVGLMLLAPVVVLLSEVDWMVDGLGVLTSFADVAGWTPLGAAWAAPADAAAGDVGPALIKSLLSLGFVALLWLAWRALVAHMLVTPQREAAATHYSGIGWFGRVGSSPAGAIAARSITYWMRDARYKVSLVIIPIVPLIMVVPLGIAGVPSDLIALLPVPVVALFLGWSIHNDVAYDNTALWLHIASNTRGRDDRIGRVLPALALGIPLTLVTSVLCAWVYGDWSVLPAMSGVGLGILLVGLGLSSVMSAQFPYPAVRPGDSPFTQPQSGNTASALIQTLSFFATIVLAGPAIVLGIASLFLDGWYNWATLLTGVVFGSFVLWAGVHLGGRLFERRAPELLAFSQRN